MACPATNSTGVFGFGGFPCIKLGFDIAFEDCGQVVVAVKLVFVGNASEVLDGVEDGRVQAPAQDGFRDGVISLNCTGERSKALQAAIWAMVSSRSW